MSLYTKQSVRDVAMHLTTSDDVKFEVRSLHENTGALIISMVDRYTKNYVEMTLYATPEQLKELEQTLYFFNLDQSLTEQEEPSVIVNRSEKVTA
jgi:hypothetical protein